MKSGASQTFHFKQRLAEKQEQENYKYKKKGFQFFGHPHLRCRVTKRVGGVEGHAKSRGSILFQDWPCFCLHLVQT